MAQRFWRFSVGKGRQINREVINLGVVALAWGYALDFDLTNLISKYKNNEMEFMDSIKDEFRRAREKDPSINKKKNAPKIIKNYCLDIQKDDLIFLYGKNPYSIDAIGIDKGEYRFSKTEVRNKIKNKYDNQKEYWEFFHLRNVSWSSVLLTNPIIKNEDFFRQHALGNKNLNFTLIEIDFDGASELLTDAEKNGEKIDYLK